MDSTNTLPQILTSQSQKEVTANALFAAASPAMVFARNDAASGAFTWGYLGGRWAGVLVANGTLTLAANATSRIVVNRSNGAVSAVASDSPLWDDAGYGRAYSVVTNATGVVSYEDHRAGPGGVLYGSGGAPSDPGDAAPLVLQIAASDLATALVAGNGKAYARAPYAMNLTGVRASLLTASTSGVVTIDVNVAGVSILSTKLTIDATEKTSVTAAAAAVISTPAIADDAEITIDIDTAGTGAKGLIVTLIGAQP